MKLFTILRFGLGLVLLLGGYSAVYKYLNTLGNQSFRNELVTVEGFSNLVIDGSIPSYVRISELGISLPVKRARIVNGYWEVFTDHAGWGEGSDLPGRSGNQVIFAHAREGLFLNLKNAKPGMEVEIKTINNTFKYRVESIKEVFPSNIEVIKQSADETLTLYTCSGNNNSMRFIVIAKRS